MKPSNFFWYNIVSITCIVGAVYLAVNGKPGWGWLMFIALCTTVVPK